MTSLLPFSQLLSTAIIQGFLKYITLSRMNCLRNGELSRGGKYIWRTLSSASFQKDFFCEEWGKKNKEKITCALFLHLCNSKHTIVSKIIYASSEEKNIHVYFEIVPVVIETRVKLSPWARAFSVLDKKSLHGLKYLLTVSFSPWSWKTSDGQPIRSLPTTSSLERD